MKPDALIAVLNRFSDLLDMAVQEASTLGASASQAVSALRGVISCVGNQVTYARLPGLLICHCTLSGHVKQFLLLASANSHSTC